MQHGVLINYGQAPALLTRFPRSPCDPLMPSAKPGCQVWELSLEGGVRRPDPVPVCAVNAEQLSEEGDRSRAVLTAGKLPLPLPLFCLLRRRLIRRCVLCAGVGHILSLALLIEENKSVGKLN